jgi:ATPase subunit of ABC transporter with duplicated ATPase domains
MSDRLLTNIIELEKTLQGEVEREEARASAWRERELAALEQEFTTSRQQLQQRQAEQLGAARRDATAAAERQRLAMAAWCERLAALPDSRLREVLHRHLPSILPEAGDDHPHGQG